LRTGEVIGGPADLFLQDRGRLGGDLLTVDRSGITGAEVERAACGDKHRQRPQGHSRDGSVPPCLPHSDLLGFCDVSGGGTRRTTVRFLGEPVTSPRWGRVGGFRRWRPVLCTGHGRPWRCVPRWWWSGPAHGRP